MISIRSIKAATVMTAMFSLSPISTWADPATKAITIKDPRNITGTWQRFPPDSFGKTAVLRAPETLYEPVVLKEPYASRYRAIREKRAAALAAGTPLIDDQVRCRPEGMPKIMTATYPIQILQTQGQVTVLAEMFTQTRRIWLDEKMANIDEIGTSYYGYSVGHWEGNDLLVETQGVRPDVDFLDIPHSDKLKIVEIYHKLSDDVLENKVTMEDSEILEHPLVFHIRYKRINYKPSEYICDNNQMVEDSDGHAIYEPNMFKKEK